MASSFQETFVIFALIGLFVYASISFIVVTQRANNVDLTILENEAINRTFTRLETNLSEFRTQTQGQKETFESEIPERGFGSLLIFSIVSIGQKFTGMIVGVYNIFIVLPSAVLGIPKIVMSVLSAILLVTLVLLVWSVYRTGR